MSALVANKEKVDDVLGFEPSAFSELPYGTFSLLVEPSSKKGKGKPHWSKDLSKRGIKSIQAINHKFAMWKSIMCEESVHGQLPQGYLIKLKNLLPTQLFAGDCAHDLGTILPSEE